jgi:CBS domain-containing protein
MTNVWLPPMNASDVVTKNVVTVSPETPTRTVAKLLLENGFSAVPVIDHNGVEALAAPPPCVARTGPASPHLKVPCGRLDPPTGRLFVGALL